MNVGYSVAEKFQQNFHYGTKLTANILVQAVTGFSLGQGQMFYSFHFFWGQWRTFATATSPTLYISGDKTAVSRSLTFVLICSLF
jgi:hypothetical protein